MVVASARHGDQLAIILFVGGGIAPGATVSHVLEEIRQSGSKLLQKRRKGLEGLPWK